jgi:predicted DsbA family dithiol-disulfide isomerase
LKIEIWSDVVCPWCYIGKRRLERALARFEHAVDTRWRSFELDPHAPPVRSGDYATRLARKYGTTMERARAAIDRMTATGAAEGLTLRFDVAQPGNTFDAHRLLQLAGARGLQGALEERLFRATFSEGEAIGDPTTLARLAIDAGLDPSDVRSVLESDRYGAEVRGDEREAREREITGVPFFLLDERYPVPGAQDPDLLLRVLQRAWERRGDAVTAG